MHFYNHTARGVQPYPHRMDWIWVMYVRFGCLKLFGRFSRMVGRMPYVRINNYSSSKLRSFDPKRGLQTGVALVLVLSGVKFHITNLPQGHFWILEQSPWPSSAQHFGLNRTSWGRKTWTQRCNIKNILLLSFHDKIVTRSLHLLWLH